MKITIHETCSLGMPVSIRSGIRSRLFRAGWLAVILVLVSVSAHAWHGQVVRVLDGDTLEIRNCRGQVVRIHLYGVESPREDQYFGRQASLHCAEMTLDSSVEVVNVGRDSRGRMRSMVWIDAVSVNEEMVRAGYAWVTNSLGLSPSCEKWVTVQRSARSRGAGLWSALESCLAQGLIPDLPSSCPALDESM